MVKVMKSNFNFVTYFLLEKKYYWLSVWLTIVLVIKEIKVEFVGFKLDYKSI